MSYPDKVRTYTMDEQVYVSESGSDASGSIARIDRPFRTIDAAIAALPSTGGVINIGIGTFAPVSQLYTVMPVGDFVKDFLIFKGSGTPFFNTGNTGLSGGTIIQGPFRFDRNNVEIYDLGVDSGSDVCTALYGGTAQNGLSFANSEAVLKAPNVGVLVSNVITICKSATSAVHGAVFENAKNVIVSNLKTRFGIHGIVIKASGGVFTNLSASGNSTDGLIVKSDDFGQSEGVTIANLRISSVTGTDTKGIVFNTESSSNPYILKNISITGYIADNITHAYTVQSGSDINRLISNISITGMQMLNGTKDTGTLTGVIDRASITINGRLFTQTIQSTTDKRAIVASSDGQGASANCFANPPVAATIPGTRTSDTVFTRTAGTWVASTLVGQYVFSYATATPTVGVWLPITANTTTTLTVSGVLHATGTSVITSTWSPTYSKYAHGQGATAFRGGCFDGQNIWLAPYSSANIIKLNPATGAITTIAHGQTTQSYHGAIFDGTNVWLIPYSSANITKVDPVTNVLTHYAHGQGSTAFIGACFDGQNIWLAPYSSANIIKLNPATGDITTIAHGQTTQSYHGAIFDGTNVWLIPYSSANITKVDPVTNVLTHYAHGQGSTAFIGACFDGQNIWMAPYASSNIIKLNVATGTITTIAHGQGGTAFTAAIFDGSNVWLIPYSSSNLLRIDAATGTFTTSPHVFGSNAFRGACFDGRHIFLASFLSDVIAKLDTRTGLIDSIYGFHGQTANSFMGAVWDGEAVWYVPFASSNIVRLDPNTGTFSAYPHGQNASPFSGGIWDGENIWLVPYGSSNIVKMKPPKAGIKTITAPLTTITHTAPGTPDYAIADVTNLTPYGFVAADEARTVLSVIANLQARLAAVEMQVMK